MHFVMISHSKDNRDRARQVILENKDLGYKWLRGGWKEEPDADTLGLEVGHEFGDDATDIPAWAAHGKAGMEKTSEGLAVFRG